MLESEIKKLTVALEANTAALLGGANALNTPTADIPTPSTIPAPTTQTVPGAAVAQAAPVVTQPAQVVLQPAQVVPAQAAQPLSHEQAQAELGAIVQALGPADTRVQATMLQYGSARLTDIPAENLFSLVQACKALLQA